jgi:hypothetical protein
MAEPDRYTPESYIVAALGLAISESSADAVRALNKSSDFEDFFKEAYGYVIPPSALSSIITMMHETDLITIDDDAFAGEFISTQKTAFSTQFRRLAEQVPKSPLAVVLRAKRPWIEKVFSSEAFWEELKQIDDRPSVEQVGSEINIAVPASDRTVTLLHNSPERLEIQADLGEIADTLRTSNEIASELGDDRERIVAELSSVEAGLASERIRVGFIHSSVMPVLTELGLKLKDKGIGLVVERLIALFTALIEHFF